MYMPNRRGKKQKTNTDGNVYAKFNPVDYYV
jgi:hypothetical protein